MKKLRHIGVIGAGECTDEIYQTAVKMGFEIGKRDWTLICGGLGGVMRGAAQGCLEAGGITIGLLPGLKKDDANPFIQIPITTGLGDGRNLMIIRSSDLLISISGGYGTLSEIALALKTNKPVIGIETWQDIQGIMYVKNPAEAIKAAEEILAK